MTVRLLTGLWFGSRDQRLGTAARGSSAGLRLRSGRDLAAATVSARPLFTSSSDNVRDRGDVLQQSKLILGISCIRLLRY